MEERQRELERICEDHPVTIPLAVAAKFCGMAPESLRKVIMQGRCPFAMGWKNGRGQDAFSVQTLPFYRFHSGRIT